MDHPILTDQPSRWNGIIGFAIFITVALIAIFHQRWSYDPIYRHFSQPSDLFPGNELWNSIIRDFSNGVCSLASLALCLIAAVAVFKKWNDWSISLIWMSVVAFGAHTYRAWLIYSTSPGLLDGQRVNTRWETRESYSADPVFSKMYTMIFCIGIGIFIVVPLLNWTSLRKSEEAKA